MIIYIIDRYIGDGTESAPYCPAILAAGIIQGGNIVTDQPTGADVTQIIPNPNVIVLQLQDGESLLQAIENHPDYGPGAILYDEPNPYSPSGKPPAKEFGERRAYCARLKISQAQFVAMFGTQTNPNTRKAGADNLTAWCKTLPKGQK